MMKYLAFILTIFLSLSLQEANPYLVEHPLIEELKSLAKSEGLEFVHGDKFPTVNPYGSYGSNYVYNFLRPGSGGAFTQSVLFLCRKKWPSRAEKSDEDPVDLVRNYNYMLVFAVKKGANETFEVHSIIDEGIGLMGMSLYYGSLGIKLSEFHYVNDPDKLGPQDESLGYSHYSTPVIISSESSTKILVFHSKENKWLEYVERDM